MTPVVLINPNFQKTISAVAQITVGPPLGLAYVASSLEQQGGGVAVIDANAENLSIHEIAERTEKSKPVLVGFSTVTPTVELCHDIAKEIKKTLPLVKFAVGGSHPTALPARTLKEFPLFDIVITGEGEETFPEVVDALMNGRGYEGIRGVCYRVGRSLRENDPRPPIEDLNSLPLPARHLLPQHLYRNMESRGFNGIIAMRGCPGRCSYCSVHNVFGWKIRLRKPESVVEELLHCFYDHHSRFISFMDDTFTWNRKWVFELCALIQKHSIEKKLKWICLTRVDGVDKEILGVMKMSGCVRVEFGIESGSQRILDRMKKNIRAEQIRDAFHAAREVGISTFGFAMINFPGEDRTSLRKTKELILELDPDLLQLSYATPYPGTELHDLCKKEGLLTTERWSEYLFLRNPVIKNPVLTSDQLRKELLSIQRAFYLRPRYVLKTLLRTFRSRGSLLGLLVAGWNTLQKILIRPDLSPEEGK